MQGSLKPRSRRSYTDEQITFSWDKPNCRGERVPAETNEDSDPEIAVLAAKFASAQQEPLDELTPLEDTPLKEQPVNLLGIVAAIKYEFFDEDVASMTADFKARNEQGNYDPMAQLETALNMDFKTRNEDGSLKISRVDAKGRVTIPGLDI